MTKVNKQYLELFAIIISLAFSIVFAIIFVGFWLSGKACLCEDNLLIRSIESIMVLFTIVILTGMIWSRIKNIGIRSK